MLGQVIVTNDDGVDAAGLQALVEAARLVGDPVVVAPSSCHSQCSHSITTARHLVVEEVRPNWYRVAGTPSDCVRLAVTHLAPNAKWLLAGINHGANLGGDVWVSGTVAAAREAALRGRHAVALSQYRRPDVPESWETSARRAATALQHVIAKRQQPGWFWNINLPAVSSEEQVALVDCRIDQLPLPAEYTAEASRYRYSASYHQRPRTPGLDVDHCFSGKITVTALAVTIIDAAE